VEHSTGRATLKPQLSQFSHQERQASSVTEVARGRISTSIGPSDQVNTNSSLSELSWLSRAKVSSVRQENEEVRLPVTEREAAGNRIIAWARMKARALLTLWTKE
jgi:hypothetical protein